MQEVLVQHYGEIVHVDVHVAVRTGTCMGKTTGQLMGQLEVQIGYMDIKDCITYMSWGR